MNAVETVTNKDDAHFYSVTRFLRIQQVPNYMLGKLEYATFNTTNPADFDQLMAYFKADIAKRVFFTESQEGGRFMMTAQLIWDIGVKQLGHIEWINIVEPPEGEAPFKGLDYTGHKIGDLSQTEELLAGHGVAYDTSYDWGHPYISLPLNTRGNEVRLAEVNFETAVNQQYDEGNFRLIYER